MSFPNISLPSSDESLESLIKTFKDSARHGHPCLPCKQGYINQMRAILARTTVSAEKRKEVEELIAKDVQV